jgi:hypothetical protein
VNARLALLLAAPIALALGWVAPAAAVAKSTSTTLHYEVRARDSRVGRATVTLGPKEKRDGVLVRAVRIEGRPEDLAGVLLAGRTVATTWVDADWMPVAAEWTSKHAGRHTETTAKYLPDRLSATCLRSGKEPLVFDEPLTQRTHDVVSLVPWLMARKLQPGEQLSAPIFTGADLCNVQAVAGPVEQVQVPMGPREAVPVVVTFNKCLTKRGFTVWLDVKDGTPHRMMSKDPLLGQVEILLLGSGKRPPADKPKPAKGRP